MDVGDTIVAMIFGWRIREHVTLSNPDSHSENDHQANGGGSTLTSGPDCCKTSVRYYQEHKVPATYS